MNTDKLHNMHRRKKVILDLVGKISVVIVFIGIALSGKFIFRFEENSSLELEENEGGKSGMIWASEREFMMTADPNLGYVPVERKIIANQQTLASLSRKREFMQQARAINGVKWSERGPIGVGGRTRAMMFDPNDPSGKKLWAGGVSGGIWYNNNVTEMNSPWIKVNDFMENLSITSLAYDPTNTNIFYASSGEFGIQTSGAGGIWKSTDGGQTWNLLSSTNPATNGRFRWIQKVIVANNGNVIAATMDLRASPDLLSTLRGGLMVSYDGGATWTPRADELNINNFSDVEVGADGTIYAVNAFHHSLFFGGPRTLAPPAIYTSADNGSTFNKQILDLSGVGIANYEGMINRIELATAPSNANKLYLAISDKSTASSSVGGEVRYMASSNDGGVSWTTNNVPTAVAQSEFFFSECYAKLDTSFTGNQGTYNLALQVHPTDENILFAGGLGWHRSSDGGQTWDDIMGYFACDDFDYHHVDQHIMLFVPGSGDEVVTGSDGGITYSDNINSPYPKYYPVNENYRVSQFYTVAMNDIAGSNYFIGGTQDNGSWAFKQQRPGLAQAQTPVGGDGAFCFIDQNEPDLQLVSFQNNGFFQTTDGFETWSSLNLTTQNNSPVNFINPAEYDSDNNILYTAGSQNQLVRVTGIGTSSPVEEILTVSEFATRNITALKISPHTPDKLFVMTVWGGLQPQLAVIENASGTYNISTYPLSVPTDPNYRDLGSLLIGLASPSGTTPYPTSIDIGSSDDQILVTFSNYGINSVWESLDGGATWANKDNSTLPDMPVRWGIYNPENTNEVLLATESGIYSTDDMSVAAPEWSPTIDGLANVRCDMLRYRPSDGMVAVATYGRGIFTTDVFLKEMNVEFEVSTSVAYINQNIQFNDVSTGPGSINSWDFGDGEDALSSNPVHSYSKPGKYNVTLTKNNGSDLKNKTISITVLPDVNPTFKSEDGGDFENGDFFAANTVSGTGFERGNSTIIGKSGTASGTNAFVTGVAESKYKALSESYLHAPNFNLGFPGTYTLSFSAKYDFEEGVDGFVIQYSLDRGDTWLVLQDDNSTSWYDTPKAKYLYNVFATQDKFFSGTVADFELKTADVSFLAGNQNVAFRFAFRSDMTQGKDLDGVEFAGAAIDDFELLGPISSLEFISDLTATCLGEAISFTGSADITTTETLTYSWDFGIDASPQTAEGLGPHAVTYSSLGWKDISLSVNGLVTKTKLEFVNIINLETIEVTASPLQMCPGESVNILLDTQPGVVYQLIDNSTTEQIAEITGEQGGVSIELGPLMEDITIDFKALAGDNCTLDLSSISFDVQGQTPIITETGGVLESSLGDSYQWYYEGSPISGAVNSTHTPFLPGEYTVEVTVGSCVSVSDPHIVTVVSIDDSDFNVGMNVYPNPAIHQITIELEDQYLGEIEISLIDARGKIVSRNAYQKKDIFFVSTIEISNLPSGIYLVRVVSGSKEKVTRISK